MKELESAITEAARRELSPPEEIPLEEVSKRITLGMLKGRPAGTLLLNATTAKKVIDAINVGATKPLAAKYAGVSPTTLNTWILTGRREITRRMELLREFTGEVPADVTVDEAGMVHMAPDSLAKFDRDQYWYDNDGRRNQIYVELLYMIREAEAKTALRWLAAIESAIQKGQWTAAAWKLEKRFPEEYGKQRHEVTGANGGEIKTRVIFEIPDNGRGDMYRKAEGNESSNAVTEMFGDDFGRTTVMDPEDV